VHVFLNKKVSKY